MKKLLLIAALFAVISASAQTDPPFAQYTKISNGYNWLRGFFKALNLPAGPAPVLGTGQINWSGGIFVDTLDGDGTPSGIYLYKFGAWEIVGTGTTYTAGSGIGISGDSIHLGGTTANPSIFQDERSIGLNGHVLKLTSGYTDSTLGGFPWQFDDSPYSPIQIGRTDSLTVDNAALSVVPLSVINATRQIKYGVGGLQNLGIYGNRFSYMHYANDSAVVRTDGGSFNHALVGEQRLKIDSNYSGTRTVYRTGPGSLTRSQGPAAVGAVSYIDNSDASKHIYIDGAMSGFMSKLVGNPTPNDTLETFIHYNTGSNISGNKKVLKMYAFAPTDLYGDSIWTFYEDQTLAYNYFKNGLSLGGGYTGIREQFRNEYNSVLNDSVTITTVREQTDTTGMDVVLRRRTDGTLQRIRADLLGVGGGTGGIDDVLAVGQALTATRTITQAGFMLTQTSTGTLSHWVNTNSTAVPWQRMTIKSRDNITGATNSGMYDEWAIDNASGSGITAAEVGVRWTDATSTSEDAQLDINLATAGAAPTNKLSIRSSGRVLVNALADTLATLSDVRGYTASTVGTYAQRIAAGTADGLEWFQTDAARDAPPGRYYFINSEWTYVPVAPERLSYDFEDFNSLGSANTIVGNYVLTATGSITPNAPGAARFSTAAGTTGRAVIYHGANGVTNAWWDIANGPMYVKVRLRDLVQLSTVGDEYILRVGVSNQTAGTEPTDGIYLMYDRLTSVNWIMVNAQNSGGASRTETPSATAVATGAHTLEIFNDGTTSEFWVDGTSLGTISTTLPNAAMFPTIQWVKSAGTTPVLLDVDYIKAWHYLTTQRD